MSSNAAARRSSPAFRNQERTSAIRSGSCGMKEPTLSDDRRRKRGRKVKTAVEAASGPHQHVRGGPGAPEALVGWLAPLRLPFASLLSFEASIDVCPESRQLGTALDYGASCGRIM